MFGRNMNMGPNQNCWSQVTFAYKFFFISSLVMLALAMIISPDMFVDYPAFTIYQFQIWRIFFAFYGQMGFLGIISVLIAFLWLSRLIPKEERQYSTVYVFADIFLQSMVIHLAFNVISFILILLFSELKELLYACGWFPIIMIYIFREAAVDPDGHTRFCCLPFLIKRKYLPWILAGFSLLFLSMRFVSMIIAALIGYYQSMVRKQNLIKLPFGFYRKLQACFPESIRSSPDFVSISQAGNLQSKCCGSGNNEVRPNSSSSQNGGGFQNPFAEKKVHKQENNFNGGGVMIDSDYQKENAFANHWRNKNLDEEESKETEEEKKIDLKGNEENKGDFEWV